MQRCREATATIKGYYYQFDHFILQLLHLPNDTDAVCIEGVEDVDVIIKGTKDAIQCKYYEGTACSPSVIAKAIRPMVEHYAKNKDEQISYKLYGRYTSGEESIPVPLTVDFLKARILTFTKNKILHRLYDELNLNDESLNGFLNHFSLNLRADGYDEQVEKVITQLCQQFQCSDSDARYFFYNNALYFVKNIAVRPTVAERTVSKAAFLKAINTKCVIFDKWYKERVDIFRYYKDIRKEYFSPINISPADRMFLIECDNNIVDKDLVRLIMEVSRKWSKISARAPSTFCPYFFFYKLCSSRMVKIKKILYENDFHIFDGHEFYGAEFSAKSLLRDVVPAFNIKAKIINDVKYVNMLLEESCKRKELYQFYLQTPFFKRENTIGIDLQIQNTIDVLKIV